MNSLNKILKLCKIDLLGLFVAHYLLGGLIPSYFGKPAQITLFLLGLGWLISLFFGLNFFHEYLLSKEEKSELVGERKNDYSPSAILTLAIVMLVIALLIGSILSIYQLSSSISYILMIILLMSGFLFIFPPTRWIDSQFNQIGFAILLIVLTPLFSYSLAMGFIHRFLIVCMIALFFLFISFLIAKDLENYLDIVKFEKKILLGILGWKQAFFIHNMFLILAYFVFSLGILLGLPSSVLLPMFFGIILVIFQLLNLHRIENGGTPNWKTTKLLAYTNFLYPLYTLILLLLI